ITTRVLRTWVLNYSLVFVAVVGFINLRFVADRTIGLALMGLGLLLLLILGTQGHNWHMEALGQALASDPKMPGIKLDTVITLRHMTLISAGLLLWVMYRYKKTWYASENRPVVIFDLALHITLLVALSYELVFWLKINAFPQFDKLGLSIFWGAYSLLLIGLGIFADKKHLRIAAIVLFGITLIKLFFYDLLHLSTMAKTIVFISLGLLLLTISFLYNKYKNKLTDKDANDQDQNNNMPLAGG
ncbi:MAG TPA: DUF2339 domain-containing protein, partial [Phnomibacter sp.]|nr:DUF2339 domain-containing protein [Phnomibacter sp.]